MTDEDGKKLVNLENLKAIYAKIPKDKIKTIYGDYYDFGNNGVTLDQWNYIYNTYSPFVFINISSFPSSGLTSDQYDALDQMQSLCAALHASGFMNGILSIKNGNKILSRALVRRSSSTPFRWIILTIID